jgi:uncharacterized protein
VFGTGGKLRMVPPVVVDYFRKHGIGVEVMSTVCCGVYYLRLAACSCWVILQENACGTFNVLNQEGRNVAACILTPSLPEQAAPGGEVKKG